MTALASLLVGCPKATRPPAPVAPVAPRVDPRGATIYEVNPQASRLHVLVYRGGALARFGHNHVMSARGLRGRIWLHPVLARSGFEVSFLVTQIVVDDPQARLAAGNEFPPEIPPADREATRRNMLRAEVLDAERFPTIALESVQFVGSLPMPQVTARITLRDVRRDIAFTPLVTVEEGRLTVTGELDLLQSDFGIQPFTAALGALTVQNQLHVKFTVVAEVQQDGVVDTMR